MNINQKNKDKVLKILNKNLPNELKKCLNFMIKDNFYGRDELIKQLENARIKFIKRDLAFKLFVFDLNKNLVARIPVEFENDSTPTAIIKFVVKNNIYILFIESGYILEFEFCNLALDDTFEIDDFSNVIEFDNLLSDY